MHRLEPVWAFFAALAVYVPAMLAAAASVTVVVLKATNILLPLGGKLCGAATLFYLCRKLTFGARAFYALASFFAALWPATDVARHFYPFLPPSVAFAIGFLCLVAVQRAGTKMIEEHPKAVLDWLWRRVPKSWRGDHSGKDADHG